MISLQKILTVLVIMGSSITSIAQYPFYFSSGNFNPPNSFSQANAVRMGTVANTNIEIAPATAVGNCYFRFFDGTVGGTTYEPNGTVDVLEAIDTPFALQVSGGHGKAFYFATTNLTDNYVFKTTGSGAPGNTKAAVLRVQGPIQSVTSIGRYPAGNVYAGQDVTITATLSDTLSPGQGVYLRYSTDNYQTSTVVEMNSSGTAYSTVIPASVNVTGAVPNYYVFTSGKGLTIAPLDADLMTINLYNNNFNNFTYTVQCPFTLGITGFEMVQTDKAQYTPGDSVHFTATFIDTLNIGSLAVKYYHLGDSIGFAIFPINHAKQFNWSWLPPNADGQGYMALLSLREGTAFVNDTTTIAIDVSSDWKHFPRYGFLSSYGLMDSGSQQLLFSTLNRYHLNGLQFYDAHYKHNIPLAGSVSHPDSVWNDIANRKTYLSTINSYIRHAHALNMKAMSYNLIYGAYSNTTMADGVLDQWGLYTDQNHQNHYTHTLPATWASNLYFENTADTSWENYLLNHEDSLFATIPYDGWHIDQVGNPGNIYNYNGQAVNVAGTFTKFITDAKTKLNNRLVMNAVAQYGQPQIASAPVDLLYTEVWEPYDSFNDLKRLIDTNAVLSHGQLATVLAAYVNKPISDTLGTFNTPAVLLADAAIFASGGAHLELGEHLLGNEYFPNSNLRMTCELQQSLIHYYDFATGYENLLRDGYVDTATNLQTTSGAPIAYTATRGKIWAIAKRKGNTQVFHLINLVNANTLNWRDPAANQPAPVVQQNVPLAFTTTQHIGKIYCASPDVNGGWPTPLAYTQTAGNVLLTLHTLNYYTMLVVQYDTATAIGEVTSMEDVKLYPNPAQSNITISWPIAYINVTLSIFDLLGREVYQSSVQSTNTASINLSGYINGLYLVKVATKDGVLTGKLLKE